MGVAAIIPAHNEAATVASVASVAKAATLVSEVIVVDNASTDETSTRASSAGATVIRCNVLGKGQAMREGVRATTAATIVFLDADLVGLTPSHVDDLVRRGASGMACGLFDRGALNFLFLRYLPVLTGQRAMPRSLFESLSDQDVEGWGVEAALNAQARKLGMPVSVFVLPGLHQVVKEDKYPSRLRGSVARLRMMVEVPVRHAGYVLRRWR